MKHYIIFALLIFAIALTAQEKEYKLDEIYVTAGRAPITFKEIARSIVVITSEEIKNLPAASLEDLIGSVASVDIRTRGINGVQSDAGIRGGTFEQTLILIDGIKVSDPQTGHHNMNLPVPVSNIERIEILKGHGSRIFGANAFSGVINIITKKRNDMAAEATAEGGSFDSYAYSLNASIPASLINSAVAFGRKKSDGYIANTDYDITDFSISQNAGVAAQALNWYYGYTNKKFGAYNFYSDRFPNQREETTTNLFYVSSEINISDMLYLSPKAYLRKNKDDYILDYTRPEWYHNIHKSTSYGIELQSTLVSDFGKLSFGGEYSGDEIESNNLGNHTREKKGFYIEQMFSPTDKINSSFGFYAYKYAKAGWKIWPGFDFAYNIDGATKIYATLGKSFRIPTFTELYYDSPANKGNPELTYEEVNNYEFGLSRRAINYTYDLNVFLKSGYNLIDWVRKSESEPWRVENVTELNTTGLEVAFGINPSFYISGFFIKNVNLGYTYLSYDRKAEGFESKYLIDNLKHQLICSVSYRLPFNINQTLILKYEDRLNYGSNFLTDTQLNYGGSFYQVYVRISNLFDVKYEEIPGILLPGRRITAGLRINYEDFK